MKTQCVAVGVLAATAFYGLLCAAVLVRRRLKRGTPWRPPPANPRAPEGK